VRRGTRRRSSAGHVVHRTELGCAVSACEVRQTGVGVHQGGLDLVGGPVVKPVTMDYVGDLESGQSDVANAFELQVRIVVTTCSWMCANTRLPWPLPT
jgi:hypothetical protein